MEIDDLAAINQQALILTIRALRAEDTRVLNELGLIDLDNQLVQQLKGLAVDHLANMPHFRGSLCQVKIDHKALRMCLGFVKNKTDEEDLVSRAIRGGMRQPMLEKLKGVGRREYNTRRERMGLPEHTKGRIESLSEENEILVLRTWETLKHIPDLLERLVVLHEETGIPLDQAFAAIRQFS